MVAAIVMAETLGGAQTNSNISQNGIQSQPTPGTDPLTLHLTKIPKGQLIERRWLLKTKNKHANCYFHTPNCRRWFCRLRYGVQLENGPFIRRTTNFLWMMIFGPSVLLIYLYRYWLPFHSLSRSLWEYH